MRPNEFVGYIVVKIRDLNDNGPVFPNHTLTAGKIQRINQHGVRWSSCCLIIVFSFKLKISKDGFQNFSHKQINTNGIPLMFDIHPKKHMVYGYKSILSTVLAMQQYFNEDETVF